jgi:hypothetical protein
VKRTSLLLALALAFALAFAASASAENKVFTLVGKGTTSSMRMQIRLHDDRAKAIRVYAQPSGVLLGVFLNEAGPEPMSKSKWFEKTFPADSRPEPFPLAAFEFRTDAATYVKSALPRPGDDTIEVHVLTGKKEQKFTFRDNPTDFTIGK